MTELFERPDVCIENRFSLRKSFDRTLNAFLAQQMEHGKRRTISVVADGVNFRAVELEFRMKAGQLQHAFQRMLVKHSFRNLQEIIEIEKIVEECRMDQQSRVDLLSRRCHEQIKFAIKFFQQIVSMTRMRYD